MNSAWTGPVLLFDGECALCARVVRMLRALDHHQRLRFAPLQSSAAQRYLIEQGLPTSDFDSLVYVPEWGQPKAEPLFRTDGALAALAAVGGIGRMLATLRVLPRGWRDGGYRLVARWRYRLFGQASAGALEKLRRGGGFLAADD